MADGTGLPIDRFGGMDWLAMVFSVPSYGVFKEPVTVRGWWRSGKTPYLEVLSITSGKLERKSLARPLRWTVAAAAFVIGIALYFLTAV